PGNVRELSNIVERMFHMSDSDVIDETLIPEAIRNYLSLNIYEQASSFNESSYSPTWTKQKMQSKQVIPFKQALNNFEKEYLRNSLNKYETLEEAADALQISLSTLMRKKRKYKLTK